MDSCLQQQILRSITTKEADKFRVNLLGCDLSAVISSTEEPGVKSTAWKQYAQICLVQLPLDHHFDQHGYASRGLDWTIFSSISPSRVVLRNSWSKVKRSVSPEMAISDPWPRKRNLNDLDAHGATILCVSSWTLSVGTRSFCV